MKRIVFSLLCFLCMEASAQYVAIRAKYIDTRLVDDFPNPPIRENRLILDFYYVSYVSLNLQWPPANLSNYDLYIVKEAVQFGNLMGGVLESTGNNYPGYAYPAPRVVSYCSTLGIEYVEC